MKNRVIICILLTLLLFSCGFIQERGSGIIVSEERELSPFSRITYALPGVVEIREGENFSLTLSVDDNIIDHISTDVSGGELIIEIADPFLVFCDYDLSIALTAPALPDMETTSSGNFAIHDAFEKEDLNLATSSSGSIRFVEPVVLGDLDAVIDSSGDIRFEGVLTADRADLTVNSTGDIILNGSTPILNIRINSSGSVQVFDFTCSHADISIDSSGSAYVHVTDSLTGRINSSGWIIYRGDPVVLVDRNSSGDIRKF